MNTEKKIGPLSRTLPKVCPACDEPIKKGDYAALIPLGPGDDEDDRKRCREGLAYDVVCVAVHWACHTGEVTP